MVGITGYGIICATGYGKQSFANALLQGRSGLSKKVLIPPLTLENSRIGGWLKDFSIDAILNAYPNVPAEWSTKAKKSLARAPLSVQTSVVAALEAWDQAQLFQHRGKMGVVVGGNNIDQDYQYQSFLSFQKEPSYLSPSYALNFLDTNHVGMLSDLFGIRGVGFTVGGATASSNVAIIEGYRQVKHGIVDICLVVGALSDLSPVETLALHTIGALGGHHYLDAPEKACRPFDRDHEGFIFGQGCGCLILENLESAKKRKAPILGQILGVAMALDGNRFTNPTQEGEARAMREAIADAGLKASDIDYINAHGTSAPLGDETEVLAIKEVFGPHVKDVWINSTKSITGHCFMAAGAVEAVATLIQMKDNFVHPTLNLDNPIDAECRFVLTKAEKAQVRYALSNSFGFGGINTSIVLG